MKRKRFLPEVIMILSVFLLLFIFFSVRQNDLLVSLQSALPPSLMQSIYRICMILPADT